MTNSNNIKLAQNISQVAVIGFGIWLLCCLCCFSSSISSMLSVKSSLDNLPGKVVEDETVNEDVVVEGYMLKK